MATRNYQSYMGPTDPNLRHSEIEGYQPVSRIGEVVINSFGAPTTIRTITPTYPRDGSPLRLPPAQLIRTSSRPCQST